MPMQIQADNSGLILRNDLVEVNETGLLSLHTEVDDLGGALIPGKVVRQTQKPDGRKQDEGILSDGFVVVIELGGVQKEDVHDRQGVLNSCHSSIPLNESQNQVESNIQRLPAHWEACHPAVHELRPNGQ